MTLTSIGEPWWVYAPHNPAAQFPTSSGGKPAVLTHWDQDPQATPMMPRTEPSHLIVDKQGHTAMGRPDRPLYRLQRKQDVTSAQVDVSHVTSGLL